MRFQSILNKHSSQDRRAKDMKNGFDIDNPFFAFMGALADIVIVNILFLICSVPVITMGASLSAMYGTMRRMREGHLTSAGACFIQAFRHSLRKSIPSWLLQLFTGVILFFDLYYVGMAPKTAVWNLIGMVTGGMLLIWMMITCYLLPAGIYVGKKIRPALAQSMYLAVRNLPYTAGMVLLNSIPVVCVMLGTYFMGVVTPIYMTAGFGITAYLNTMLLEKCRELSTWGQA